MSLFHLTAPSGYCIKQHAALCSIQRLTDMGYQVSNVEVTARRCEHFAGTETEHLEGPNSLARLTIPNIIALSVRDGYGASRLLADIDWQALMTCQQHDLLLIYGHSDFTAVQCDLLAQNSVITFSGPMLVANFGADELNAFTEHHFWLALHSKTFTAEWRGEGPMCQIEGVLWGGSPVMLISLIGTLWMPKIKDGTLVLEDTNEHPLRVEHILLQLYRAGILPRQKAVILGSFSGSTPNDYSVGYNLESVYTFLCFRLSILLITGLDFSRKQRTITLPLGAHAIPDNTQKGAQLMISGHPVLRM